MESESKLKPPITANTNIREGIPCLIQNAEKDTVYYVSYNDYSVSLYGSDTTSLIKNGIEFYILNGDHREAYRQFSSFEECRTYFINNLDKINKYSDK